MSAGSVIVLIIVAVACVSAVVYNVRRRGSCNCGGCTGCSENSGCECASSSDANGESSETEMNSASQNKIAHYSPASFACSSCAMKNSCNHAK